ncbi:MAG: DNA/RNA non-specific endonuclease [Lentimicrobiaceae bacterium]|nr:DNA/RNA non-specific endonuclease [Lentimicrobiaceae bacterium]
MKKSLLLFALMLCLTALSCQEIDLNNIEIPTITDERSDRIITHKGFTLSYNYDWKIPNWVAYELTDIEVMGEVPRYDKFKPDPMVPQNVSATTNDYKHSGYDRGHLAPAADMKWDEQAMRESFYLSNICPQNPNLNGGVWKDLEEQVRDLASQKGSIFVACGPIVTDASTTIGENKVVVPQAFFKVLLQEEEDGKIHTIGFVYENISGRKPMSTYAMTIDEVEEITGIDFFPSLPNKIEKKTESEVDFTKWTLF